jgi:hypothetical protein
LRGGREYTSSQSHHEATLQYTEYRFVIIEHSVELYSALVAITPTAK